MSEAPPHMRLSQNSTTMPADTTKPSVYRHQAVKSAGDDSSEHSQSDESALVATSVTDNSTAASDYGTHSESDSELSESSEEPSSESSSEDDDDDRSDVEMQEHQGADGVVNLLANRGKKPTMKLDQEELGPDIRTFLKDFLPQLKAANEELEAQKKAGTLKSLEMGGDGDEEQHIEMDLGLGVLEAKDPNANHGSTSESEGSDTEGEKEKDVLGKLLGRKKTDAPPVVQEVDNVKGS